MVSVLQRDLLTAIIDRICTLDDCYGINVVQKNDWRAAEVQHYLNKSLCYSYTDHAMRVIKINSYISIISSEVV